MKKPSRGSLVRNLSPAMMLFALARCSAPQQPAVTTTQLEPLPFELHSGMWINLHQELLHHARSGWKWRHRVLPDRESDPAWQDALELYRARYAELENLDASLSAIAVEIAGARDDELPTVDPELRTALSRAAETYRRTRWPEDDPRNREWISGVTPLLERHGAAMRREIAGASEISWPRRTLPIAVVTFVDPFGAQTTDAPAPITLISSADPGYAGEASLEMIFHEASHLFDDRLRSGIAEECRPLGVAEPEGLWHALLFYTAGYFAKKHLGESYVTYAEKNGLYKRGDWPRYLPVIVEKWEPHLRGETTLEEALRSLVESLGRRS
jgi:hypothetical protein